MTFPFGWYWIADDGRVYSAPKQSVVTVDDPEYVAFLQGGRMSATPWPRDMAGNQTNEELQKTIGQHGLSLSPADALIAYAANKRWVKETGGITVGGMSILTDDRSKQMLMGARLFADSNPEFSTAWVCGDGTIVVVNAAQIAGVSDAVLSWVASCFATFAAVQAQITATPPTITTTAQIDSAFA
jgi:hypothetical protein